MAFNKQNISDNTATKITGASTASIVGMRISNAKSSGAVTVDLYKYKKDDCKLCFGDTRKLQRRRIWRI